MQWAPVCSGSSTAPRRILVKNTKIKPLSAFAESLKEICAYAEQQRTDYTLWVSLEQFDRDVDKKSLVGPIEDTLPLCQAVRAQCGNFGLLRRPGAPSTAWRDTTRPRSQRPESTWGTSTLAVASRSRGTRSMGINTRASATRTVRTILRNSPSFSAFLFEIGYFDSGCANG